MIFLSKVRQLYRNIRLFGPLIWTYNWWDHAYFLDVLSRLTRDMANHHDPRLNPRAFYSLDSDKKARDMRIVSLICLRLISDDYNQKAIDEFYEDSKFCFRPIPGSRYAELCEDYAGRSSAKEREVRRKQMYLRQKQLRQADLDLMTRILNKHLLSWWD